jgi:hypothetical protein
MGVVAVDRDATQHSQSIVIENSHQRHGANPGYSPTIVSNNASVCKKIINATSSIVRFENKKPFSSTLKNALAYYNAGVVALCKFKCRRICSCDHELLGTTPVR